MRYKFPIQWRSPDGRFSLALRNLGRKLLGYLELDRALGGVTTNAKEVRLEDGRIVRARMADEMPIVEIVEKEGEGKPLDTFRCKMYLESGLLDLDVFESETIPTLYFGDNMDCELLGEVKITYKEDYSEIKITPGDCISPGLTPIPAKACDTPPDQGWTSLRRKKNAQRRTPASLWTGLMRRWVQAIYGNPKSKYESRVEPESGPPGDAWLAKFFLCLRHSAENEGDKIKIDFRFEHSWGLADLGGGDYVFLHIEKDTKVHVHQALNNSACAGALLRYLRKEGVGTEVNQRLESFLLSEMYPNHELLQTIEFEIDAEQSLEPRSHYGWKFNSRGNKASAVLFFRPPGEYPTAEPFTSRLVTLTFSRSGTGLVAVTVTEVEAPTEYWAAEKDWLMEYAIPTNNDEGVICYDTGLPRPVGAPTPPAPNPRFDFDVPVYCWYEIDDTLTVVRYSFEKLGTGEAAFTEPCYENFPNPVPNYQWDANFKVHRPWCTELCYDCDRACTQSVRWEEELIAAGFYVKRQDNEIVSSNIMSQSRFLKPTPLPGTGYDPNPTIYDWHWEQRRNASCTIETAPEVAETHFTYECLEDAGGVGYGTHWVPDGTTYCDDQVAFTDYSGTEVRTQINTTACEAGEDDCPGDSWMTGSDTVPCPVPPDPPFAPEEECVSADGAASNYYTGFENQGAASEPEAWKNPVLVIPNKSATGVYLRTYSSDMNEVRGGYSARDVNYRQTWAWSSVCSGHSGGISGASCPNNYPTGGGVYCGTFSYGCEGEHYTTTCSWPFISDSHPCFIEEGNGTVILWTEVLSTSMSYNKINTDLEVFEGLYNKSTNYANMLRGIPSTVDWDIPPDAGNFEGRLDTDTFKIYTREGGLNPTYRPWPYYAPGGTTFSGGKTHIPMYTGLHTQVIYQNNLLLTARSFTATNTYPTDKEHLSFIGWA